MDIEPWIQTCASRIPQDKYRRCKKSVVYFTYCYESLLPNEKGDKTISNQLICRAVEEHYKCIKFRIFAIYLRTFTPNLNTFVLNM